MEVKIIKKLGSGVMGTVYLVESGGKKYIYKIEKFQPESKPLLHAYERQVDFDRKVASKHPDKFLVLNLDRSLRRVEQIYYFLLCASWDLIYFFTYSRC